MELLSSRVPAGFGNPSCFHTHLPEDRWELFIVPKSYYCVFSGSLYIVCSSALAPGSCYTGIYLYNMGLLLPF